MKARIYESSFFLENFVSFAFVANKLILFV